jgi:hypothetical protein
MKSVMKVMFVKAILFLLTSSAAAQITSNLTKTVFWSQKALAVQASCQTGGCLAYAAIFCSVGALNCVNTDPTELKIVCPQPAGDSCTFHIGVEASMFIGGYAD